MLSSAHLQKPFESGRRVFRALPLVAVRKKHDEPARSLPLRFEADDELVDDALRAVREVAKLSFPENESSRGIEREAEFEAEHSFLAEQAVVNPEVGRRLCQSFQRHMTIARDDVRKRRMPLAEGSAARVLAREAYACTFRNQRAERQRLRRGPVDSLAEIDRFPALLQQADDLGVNVDSRARS